MSESELLAIGDRVRIKGSERGRWLEKEAGKEFVITTADGKTEDGATKWAGDDNPYWWREDELELVLPATPERQPTPWGGDLTVLLDFLRERSKGRGHLSKHVADTLIEPLLDAMISHSLAASPSPAASGGVTDALKMLNDKIRRADKNAVSQSQWGERVTAAAWKSVADDLQAIYTTLEAALSTSPVSREDVRREAIEPGVRLRFFRDLTTAERMKVYAVLGAPANVLAEVSTHTHEVLLLTKLLGRALSPDATKGE